jgi:hypothetical protein
VRGRGLLLASSNSIGQNANQSVFATLICEPTAPFVERSTSPAGENGGEGNHGRALLRIGSGRNATD